LFANILAVCVVYCFSSGALRSVGSRQHQVRDAMLLSLGPVAFASTAASSSATRALFYGCFQICIVRFRATAVLAAPGGRRGTARRREGKARAVAAAAASPPPTRMQADEVAAAMGYKKPRRSID
jgi:hypothetical protein